MDAEWELMGLCNDAVYTHVRGFVSDHTLCLQARVCVKVVVVVWMLIGVPFPCQFVYVHVCNDASL